MEGRIKRVLSKGYGFIETDAGIDFYFHHTAYKGNYKDLLKRFVSDEIIIVSFDNDPTGPDGPRAVNVEIKQSL